jgi:hypothetical protein
MKAWQTTCIVCLVAFTGFYLARGKSPVAAVPDALPEAAANAVAPELYAEASAKLAAALRAARPWRRCREADATRSGLQRPPARVELNS